jgi:ribosomal protein S1
MGVIIKYNKHGALASIEEGVAGLVHISEFASEEELRNTLLLGQSYPFTITLFEPKDQRMTLSWKKKEEVK